MLVRPTVHWMLLFVGLSSVGCDPTVPGWRQPRNAGSDPTNTAVNERDRDAASLTPTHQQENQSDLQATAAIRRAIMADESMSTNAQNCKVITANGVTTLRGVVNSDAEKASIEAKAVASVGAGSVVNELEVRRPIQ